MAGSALFEGGRVFTGRRYVEALLVEGGRVVVAGSLQEVRRVAPTGVERVPLEGRLLVPGLIDAHLHVGELGRARDGPPLDGLGTTDALVDRVARWAAAHPTEPVVGRGFDLSGLPRRRWPTAQELDRAVADRVVAVTDRSGHVLLVNGRALELVDLAGPDAEHLSSSIGRTADGSPDGVFVEEAMRLFGDVLADRATVTSPAVRRTLEHLASVGLTAVAAMSVGPKELAGLRETYDGGMPLPRIRAFVRLHDVRDLGPGDVAPRGDRFAVAGVKAFLDGAFGPRTAALQSPYADDPTSTGQDVGDDRRLEDELADAVSRGLAPAVHAIGDRAVRRAATVFEKLVLPEGMVPRIEHASLVPPDVLGAVVRSGATTVVQPGFVLSDRWLAERLGPDRVRWAYPFRTLLTRGIAVAGSSDAPYDPEDPWRGIRAAVRRRDSDGGSANPEPSEALPVEEALGLYTHAAARSLGWRGGGPLEAGAPADLVILSVPRLDLALEAERPVAETWIGGERGFPRPDGAADETDVR